MNMDSLIKSISKSKIKKIVVAEAQDEMVLEAVSKAYSLDIATPILCGNKDEINRKAVNNNIDISKFEIINTTNSEESVKEAISVINSGGADVLMKGLIQTSELLKGVLNKEKGLRGKGILSHVAIMDSIKLGRTIILTDSAMAMYPDVKTKVNLINNAVLVAKNLGIETPKVGVIAATEQVNLEMQATVDAAILTVMNNRGQIKDCIVDGPFALDVAISRDAALHKGIVSKVAGSADILLFHNIEAANSAYKIMGNMSEGVIAGVIIGAKVPIVLTSRSDSDHSKLYSIACAVSIRQN